MSQAERDRLVALKKAAKGLITRKQAAEELKISERQVYRYWQDEERGDKVVIHRCAVIFSIEAHPERAEGNINSSRFQAGLLWTDAGVAILSQEAQNMRQ